MILLLAAIGGIWLVEHLFSLLYRIADILLLFGLAWLLKLLLDPLIRRLQGVGLPNGMAIAIAYLLAVGIVVGGVVALTPQISAITLSVPSVVQQIAERAEVGAIWLQQRGFEIDPQALTNQIVGFGGQFGSRLAGQVVSLAQQLLNLVGRIALVMTVSVFMSLTDGRLRDVMRPVVPPRWREEFDAFVSDVNSAYASYIRSYFYLAALGTLMSAALLFGFRIPGAVLWLVAVFVLRLLPFIGGTLADLLLVLVFFFELPYGTGIIAIGLIIVGQFLLTNVVMPRVMSRELGINPLVVLFAVLLGGRIYGVAGILFAVPAAAIIATVAAKAVNRYLVPLYARPGWWSEEVPIASQEIVVPPSDAVERASATSPLPPIRPVDPPKPRLQEHS